MKNFIIVRHGAPLPFPKWESNLSNEGLFAEQQRSRQNCLPQDALRARTKQLRLKKLPSQPLAHLFLPSQIQNSPLGPTDRYTI